MEQTHAHANRALVDSPGGQGWGRQVLGSLHLLSNTEPWALPGQMANELSRGDGDPMGSSFMPHSVSQDATLSPADTLVYTFISKEGPAGCSHSHLDGNKQLLTKEEKTQTLWASSWQRRSVVDFFFF